MVAAKTVAGTFLQGVVRVLPVSIGSVSLNTAGKSVGIIVEFNKGAKENRT
jgi:hypothetical protein